jgi:agmatinase
LGYCPRLRRHPSYLVSASPARFRANAYDLRYDNTWALQQIEEGHNSILSRSLATNSREARLAKSGKTLPRVITLGGDHTITLPLLRSINRAYGPVSVIHFDSHLDTWKPKVFGGAPSQVASINHGTYFYHAAQESLLANDSNIHAGIRTTLSGPSDYENDGYRGFEIVEAREVDTIGVEGSSASLTIQLGQLSLCTSLLISTLLI